MKILMYPVKVQSSFVINLPIGAKILSVQVQNESPNILALVDESAKTEQRVFAVTGTGHEIRFHAINYIGTFQLAGGSFVGHLFDITPAKPAVF